MEAAGNADVVSKGRFAQLRNVSPGRVSQWISEGKIKGDALVGEGRNAKINARLAVLQLRNALDITQRAGNGLETRLDLPEPTAPEMRREVEPTAPAPAVDPFEAEIKRERLEQLRRANRKLAEEEAARAGRFTDAADAARQLGKIGAQMMSVFEGSLSEIATAIGARFEIPQRDVLHLLRAEFRKVRLNGAKLFRDQAAQMPETVEADLEEIGSA